MATRPVLLCKYKYQIRRRKCQKTERKKIVPEEEEMREMVLEESISTQIPVVRTTSGKVIRTVSEFNWIDTEFGEGEEEETEILEPDDGLRFLSLRAGRATTFIPRSPFKITPFQAELPVIKERQSVKEDDLVQVTQNHNESSEYSPDLVEAPIALQTGHSASSICSDTYNSRHDTRTVKVCQPVSAQPVEAPIVQQTGESASSNGSISYNSHHYMRTVKVCQPVSAKTAELPVTMGKGNESLSGIPDGHGGAKPKCKGSFSNSPDSEESPIALQTDKSAGSLGGKTYIIEDDTRIIKGCRTISAQTASLPVRIRKPHARQSVKTDDLSKVARSHIESSGNSPDREDAPIALQTDKSAGSLGGKTYIIEDDSRIIKGCRPISARTATHPVALFKPHARRSVKADILSKVTRNHKESSGNSPDRVESPIALQTDESAGSLGGKTYIIEDDSRIIKGCRPTTAHAATQPVTINKRHARQSVKTDFLSNVTRNRNKSSVNSPNRVEPPIALQTDKSAGSLGGKTYIIEDDTRIIKGCRPISAQTASLPVTIKNPHARRAVETDCLSKVTRSGIESSSNSPDRVESPIALQTDESAGSLGGKTYIIEDDSRFIKGCRPITAQTTTHAITLNKPHARRLVNADILSEVTRNRKESSTNSPDRVEAPIALQTDESAGSLGGKTYIIEDDTRIIKGCRPISARTASLPIKKPHARRLVETDGLSKITRSRIESASNSLDRATHPTTVKKPHAKRSVKADILSKVTRNHKESSGNSPDRVNNAPIE